MSYVGGPVAWRVPIAFQVFFVFVVVFLVFGVPESPRWLYYHGRKEEGLQVLCDVWNAPPDDPKVSKMVREIEETMAVENERGGFKWRNLMKRDEVQTGRRVLLAYGMQFMNQYVYQWERPYGMGHADETRADFLNLRMGGINLVVYVPP